MKDNYYVWTLDTDGIVTETTVFIDSDLDWFDAFDELDVIADARVKEEEEYGAEIVRVWVTYTDNPVAIPIVEKELVKAA